MYQKPDRPEKNYRHLKSHSLDQVIYSRHVRTVQHMQINERAISHKKKKTRDSGDHIIIQQNMSFFSRLTPRWTGCSEICFNTKK